LPAHQNVGVRACIHEKEWRAMNFFQKIHTRTQKSIAPVERNAILKKE